MITPTALEEFKTIMLEDYGVMLDDTKATRLANDYLVALEAVLTPPREKLTKRVEEAQNEAQRPI